MFNQLKKLSLGLCVAVIALGAIAETEVKDSDIPTLNADEGRFGEIRKLASDTEFRVCTDPDNMPYSNVHQEGFEDKIAKLIAKDLGMEPKFAYAYNRFGFLRNTINAYRCDVIIGTAKGYDPLTTTKPYYASGHIFVWRKESGYNIKDFDAPELRKAVIGLVDKSPAAVALDAHGLMAQAVPYRMQRNLHKSPGYLIQDLEKGVIDVAISWGPLAGYYIKNAKVPLEWAFVPEFRDQNKKGRLNWNIAMGVRKRDNERAEMLNAALERNKDGIAKIMKSMASNITC